jgi:hypothetical protein
MKKYKDKQRIYFNIEDNETIIKTPYEEEKNHGHADRRSI